MKSLYVVALAIAAVSIHAQRPVYSTRQAQGDTTANHTNSQTQQAGNSSASNASGVQIDPRINQNAIQTQTTQGTISGGNTSSGASAQGNQTTVGQTNLGNSSASTGPSSANVGNVTSGPSTSSATNGGNTSANTNSDSSTSAASQTANGGAGGVASVGAVAGGTGTASTGAVSNNIGGDTNNVRVDARSLFLPSVTPQIQPGFINSGGFVHEVTGCGPLMVKTTVDITEVRHHMFGKDTYEVVGTKDVITRAKGEPFEVVSDGQGGHMLIGSQVSMTVTKIGSSTNRGISGAGNGGMNFTGGQIGLGSANAKEHVVSDTTVLPCYIPVQAPPPVAPQPIAHVEVPPAASTPALSAVELQAVHDLVNKPKPALHKHRAKKAAVCVPKAVSNGTR